MIVNLVNTLNKGGDFDAYYEAGRRVLSNEPLYTGSAVAYGFVGPPAQALLFAPLALVAPIASRLMLVRPQPRAPLVFVDDLPGSVRPGSERRRTRARAPDGPGWRRGLRLLQTRWAVLSLLAIAFPLQTQFEHQNLNIVLLALTAYAAESFMRHRPIAGGAALGIATAIKIYPGVALAWLALRREWRALGAGVAAAAALTVAPALIRGPHAFMADLADFEALAREGWPTRRANQSLFAMWGRYLSEEGPDGYPNLTLDQPLVLWLVGATASVVVVPLAAALWRRRPSSAGLVEELMCVGALAILVSPIAWEHYWVGFFPLCLLLAVYAWRGGSSWQSRWARASFWVGVVGITVLSRPIVGSYGASVVRAWSLMTWAGVVMCATFAAILASSRVGTPSGSRWSHRATADRTRRCRYDGSAEKETPDVRQGLSAGVSRVFSHASWQEPGFSD